MFIRIRGLDYARNSYENSVFRLKIGKLDIPSGSIVALIGESGSGKTTLLNLIGGMESLHPSSEGQIEIELSTGVVRLSANSNTKFPFGKVGRVFQNSYLISTATVAVNLAVACEGAKVPYSRQMLATALSYVDLTEEYLDRRAWQLSGGEAQRVAIARAFVSDPELIFADELTSGADPALAEKIMEYVSAWINHGLSIGKIRTVIWVTHEYRLASRFADGGIVVISPNIINGKSISEVNSIQPVVNPVDEESIREMVGIKKNTNQGKFFSALEIGFEEFPNKSIAAKIMFADVFSTENRVGDFKKIARLTHLGGEHPALEVRPILSSFSPMALLFRHISIFILTCIVVLSYSVLDRRYDATLSNPSICHVVIGGTINSPYSLSKPVLAFLATEPWPDSPFEYNGSGDEYIDNLAFESSSAGCNPESIVWPRYIPQVKIGLVDEDGLCGSYKRREKRLERIDTMAIHSKEPWLSVIPVLNSGSLSDAQKQLIGNPLQMHKSSIIVSEKYAQSVLGKSVQEMGLVETVCANIDGADIRPIRLAGIANELPADRVYMYEAIMALEALEVTIDEIEDYSTAAIYFKDSNISLLRKWLNTTEGQNGSDGQRFTYDPQVLDNFTESIDLAKSLQVLMIAVLFIVFCMNIVNMITSYLEMLVKQAKTIVMQLSIGATKMFVLRYLCYHAFLVSTLGVIFGSFILIGPLVYAYMEVAAFDIGLVFESFLYSALISIGIAVFGLGISFYLWFRDNKGRFAEILQAD